MLNKGTKLFAGVEDLVESGVGDAWVGWRWLRDRIQETEKRREENNSLIKKFVDLLYKYIE